MAPQNGVEIEAVWKPQEKWPQDDEHAEYQGVDHRHLTEARSHEGPGFVRQPVAAPRGDRRLGQEALGFVVIACDLAVLRSLDPIGQSTAVVRGPVRRLFEAILPFRRLARKASCSARASCASRSATSARNSSSPSQARRSHSSRSAGARSRPCRIARRSCANVPGSLRPPIAKLAVQPGPREATVPLDRHHRDVERRGDLRDRQPAEIAQGHGLPWRTFSIGQAIDGLMNRHDVERLRIEIVHQRVERYALPVAAPPRRRPDAVHGQPRSHAWPERPP